MALPSHTNSRKEVRILENAEELAVDLAEYVAELSDSFVRDRGAFSIALSGCSLAHLLRKLGESPYLKTVDWSKWYVFLTDERVVSKTHHLSNYKHLKEGFFSKLPLIPSHVHSINNSATAEQAADDYEFLVRQLVKTRAINASESSDCPKFDLIVLEMGCDGHVASLFPNHAALEEKNQWVAFFSDSPEPPPERVTFTLPVINAAANVAVVASGDDKADCVRVAVGDWRKERSLLPARMLEPTSGHLVWFLDTQAASMI